MTKKRELLPPVCWIVAGPNGAGKTTFAFNYLSKVAQCARFINADLIAAGLSPLAPERNLLSASRIFLDEIKAAVEKRDDFAFETTLSGRGHIHLVEQLLNEGWKVELVYLALPSVEMSRLRVAERVSHGGHNISPKDIRRRFPRSLHNLLNIYGPLVTRARCFMNDKKIPELVFEQRGHYLEIFDHSLFEMITQEAQR